MYSSKYHKATHTHIMEYYTNPTTHKHTQSKIRTQTSIFEIRQIVTSATSVPVCLSLATSLLSVLSRSMSNISYLSVFFPLPVCWSTTFFSRFVFFKSVPYFPPVWQCCFVIGPVKSRPPPLLPAAQQHVSGLMEVPQPCPFETPLNQHLFSLLPIPSMTSI